MLCSKVKYYGTVMRVFSFTKTVCIEMPSLFDQICYQGTQPYNIPIQSVSLPSDISEHSFFGRHSDNFLFVDRERRKENYTYRENQAIHHQGVCEFCTLLRRFTLMEEYQSLYVE